MDILLVEASKRLDRDIFFRNWKCSILFALASARGVALDDYLGRIVDLPETTILPAVRLHLVDDKRPLLHLKLSPGCYSFDASECVLDP